MNIIITSPSLDPNTNVTGISSVTQFIIDNNADHNYIHFELGKKDAEHRNVFWFLRILLSYFNWCVILFKTKDALVHFNFAMSKPSIIRDSPLIIISRLFRTKMIIHLHGGEYLMHREMPLWMKLTLRLDFSGSIRKVVLSTLEAEALRSRLKTRNIFVLPNCVDLEDASNYKRELSTISELRLLFLGRISEKKGIEYIFQALQSLKEKGIKFRFVMAGKGEEESIYVPRFKDLLGNDFHFPGVVFGQAKIKLLEESNVFLLPSFFEGLPMSLLESMSFGMVPIVTEVGSIKQVITDGVNGIFVNKYSSDDIAAAIERLYSDPIYMNSLSQNARQYIFANYNPKEYIYRLNQIYNYKYDVLLS
jgi:glycosyltransferase involved in cell wall biosynthesis